MKSTLLLESNHHFAVVYVNSAAEFDCIALLKLHISRTVQWVAQIGVCVHEESSGFPGMHFILSNDN